MDYKKSDPLFSLAVVAQLTDLHPRTVMLYERVGLISPFRTKTNRRRYSQVDVEQIKFIHFLAESKKVNLTGIKLVFTILEAAKKLNSNITKELFPEFKP